MMRLFNRMFILVLIGAVVYGASTLNAEEEITIYTPSEGHQVVIYTHKHGPDDKSN